MGGGADDVQAVVVSSGGGAALPEVNVLSDIGYSRWSSPPIDSRILSVKNGKPLLPWFDGLLRGRSGAHPPIVRPGETPVSKSLDGVADAAVEIARSTSGIGCLRKVHAPGWL